MLIMVLQFFHIVIFLKIVQWIVKFENDQLPPDIFIIIFFIIFFILLLRYYNKSRIKRLIDEFNLKTEKSKPIELHLLGIFNR